MAIRESSSGAWLALITHPVVLDRKHRLTQRRRPDEVQAGHIGVGEYGEHPGRGGGHRSVDMLNPPGRHGGWHQHGIRDTLYLGVGRVDGGAGELGRTIRPAQSPSHRSHDSLPALDPIVPRARTTARCASSTLKALPASGRASANDAASAVRSRGVSASDTPCSAASASPRRQGRAATPPSASRASVITSPSRTTATATETIANSYEARSRTFR